ncbi:hypothetical protein AIOL_003747 [Candidatus Rhodobacter oscarellae]|uniref:Metal-binding protein n=1 Tax=Candidatus Rhodobacter oscarellae TaxID=1675527 RepID=A0A0J9E7R4_9RHOB|nr:DUF1636 domain-containing protein [Candidatus Rhodobacter lobularis]KMW58767.1 hypothetical protein AIOL_003747 [Candidatus Rhodobacter lobularis]
MQDEPALLSVCTTCRDGREKDTGARGGSRLAKAIHARLDELIAAGATLRGVTCMSQCKRPCIVSLCQDERFTYVFGDLDPERPEHIDALLDLVARYKEAPEGFLGRTDRPEPLRANILGRFPPTRSASLLVTHLDPIAAE